MLSLLALALVASARPRHDLLPRTFAITEDGTGEIATSLLPTSVQSTLPTQTAVSTYDSNALANLWSIVEADLPVEVANITTVISPTNFTVPDTPPLPYSLQDHAGSMMFPEGFLFGVASAAQQYEGAVKADGRGPSAWDYLCHRLPAQCNNYTSDITDNGRYLYKSDLARIKAMGINTYSFSISWTRVVPFGKAGSPVSQEGLDYYSDLVDTCISMGIKPVATLFHWDTPLNLIFEYGAFLNESIIDDYVSYTQVVFKKLGDRVTSFLTFNEPRVYCSQYTAEPYTDYYSHWSYATLNATTAAYPCSYNLLKAHGRAVQGYRQLVSNGTIKSGEIALKNDDSYPLPADENNDQDVLAAKRHFDFYIGIFSQPIYGDGNYPENVRNTIPEAFLPNLSSSDMASIKGSADFYAIDGYRTNIARAAPNGISTCAANISDPNWPACQDGSNDGQYATTEGYAIGPVADPGALWLYNTAIYVRRQFQLLQQAFNFKKLYLSEFGFARPFEYLFQNDFEILFDSDRAAYYVDYLTACLYSIHEDGIPLAGIFAWSLVDNFEWNSGLNQKFGLQYVNYTTQERHYKMSFLLLRDFGKAHLSS